MGAGAELADAIRARYAAAKGKDKRRILDEFIAATGYHEKSAIRVLNGSGSKRLKAVLPILVPAVERNGHLKLDEQIRPKILSMSEATVDRLLRMPRGMMHARKAPRPTPEPHRAAARTDGTDDRLAGVGGDGLCGLAARTSALIRVEAVWLAVEPLDLRAGMESVLNRVVTVFGAARPHHAYLFSNRRANRIKVLVHDGIGVWLAARRLNAGRFVWPPHGGGTLTITRAQFDALVLGLPWQRIGEAGIITVL